MVEVPAAASMGSVSVSMAIVLDGIDLQRGPTNEIHNRQLRTAPEHAHIYRADSDSGGAPMGFVRTNEITHDHRPCCPGAPRHATQDGVQHNPPDCPVSFPPARRAARHDEGHD